MNKNSVKIFIIIAFLLVGVIPVAFVGNISFRFLHNIVLHQHQDHLQSIRATKKEQVEAYFAACEADMQVLLSMLNTLTTLSPQTAEEEWLIPAIPLFDEYIQRYQYYDLFLIRPDGYCFHSAAYEVEYQTNLLDGPYADSGLGKLVRTVLQTRQFGMADMEPYAPSNNAPAAFIAQPLIQDDTIILVVALQLSLGSLNTIMQQRAGLGYTGEAYLVGPDLLMRSDSFLDPVNHSVMTSFANPMMGTVDTEAVHAALSGETGVMTMLDYTGNPVVSAYAPLSVGGTTWGILVEMVEAEVLDGVNHFTRVVLVLVLVALIVTFIVAVVMSLVLPLRGTQKELNGQFPNRDEHIQIRTMLDKLINR